jgi:hypothetical protein
MILVPVFSTNPIMPAAVLSSCNKLIPMLFSNNIGTWLDRQKRSQSKSIQSKNLTVKLSPIACFFNGQQRQFHVNLCYSKSDYQRFSFGSWLIRFITLAHFSYHLESHSYV